MGFNGKTILWFRRDLRLGNNRALIAAAGHGTVVPVYIREPGVEALGAAPKLRLEIALRALSCELRAAGSRLILRSGAPGNVLRALVKETGANAVMWNRRYDPVGADTDRKIKAALRHDGIEARSFAGTLLFEPWTVATGQGGPYRVYTPFWKAVRDRDVPAPVAAPDLIAPVKWPESEVIGDWALGKAMRRGAEVVAGHVEAGEAAALARLRHFVSERIGDYKAQREFLDREATSGLSDALSLGEISAGQCWHAAHLAIQAGAAGAEHFLKELVWREFAWHLMWHFPRLAEENWRDDWNGFPWIEDAEDARYRAWCQGRTGVPLVDAAMREMYVTGKMHNRARMIAASYLTKHLRVHWRLGLKWFETCLVDWDAASNAMGWQWVAGCGPDAAPYFRIYNPDTQAEKFDPAESYRRKWLAEPFGARTETALSYFDAIPEGWGLSPEMGYPAPIMGVKAGREAALLAYESFKSQ